MQFVPVLVYEANRVVLLHVQMIVIEVNAIESGWNFETYHQLH